MAVIVSLPLYAQRKEQGYGKFDFEMGFEVPVAAFRFDGAKNEPIPFLHMEGRWQLEPQPVDIGFHLGISAVKRNGYSSYRAIPVLFIADWQFGRGNRFNPYVGMGAGVSLNDIVFGSPDYTNFAISPRVGVRCFKFMNLSAGWLVTKRDYSRLYANLGFYF